jgi:hypothetical protein
VLLGTLLFLGALIALVSLFDAQAALSHPLVMLAVCVIGPAVLFWGVASGARQVPLSSGTSRLAALGAVRSLVGIEGGIVSGC